MTKNKFEIVQENTAGGKEKLKQKKVFIEIGTNQLPVPWFGKKEFKEDEIYVGIEKNKYDIEQAREHIKDLDVDTSHMYFVRAYAEELPVASGVAEEVFLGNVIGDPDIDPETKDAFIEEAKRIVAEDGVIVIKETNTPASVIFMRDLLRKHGLRVLTSYGPESPEWKQEIAQYEGLAINPRYEKLYPGSYLIFLEPIKEQ